MIDLASQFYLRIKKYISSNIYKKAFALRYMKNGNPDYLYTGRNPPHNVLKKAFKLFFRAAKLGNDNAQYELAKMYYHGYGIEADKELFEYWSILAYEQGHAMALFYLADYHRATQRRVKSGETYIDLIDLAYEEYETLAQSGIAEAQEILGDMYRIGEGNREPDREKALYWYNLASENGMTDAMEMIEHMESQS